MSVVSSGRSNFCRSKFYDFHRIQQLPDILAVYLFVVRTYLSQTTSCYKGSRTIDLDCWLASGICVVLQVLLRLCFAV